MSDNIAWMCSTSAKCNNKFLYVVSWTCERVMIQLGFDINVVFVLNFIRGCSIMRKLSVTPTPA